MNNLDVSIDSKKQEAAIKAFSTIAKDWELTINEQEQLLKLPKNSILTGPLGEESLLRISHCIAIYKGLHRLFTNQQQSNSWVRKNNAAFNQEQAINLMTANDLNKLIRVRKYIDSQLV